MTTSRMRSRELLRWPLTGLILATAVLHIAAAMVAPAAHADPIDGRFLNALQSRNINFATPQAAIVAGHQVCVELDQGRQKSDVANEVAGSNNLDGYRAGYFVGLSISAYCPRHHGTA